MNIRSRLPEGWLIILGLVLIMSFLLMLIPYGRLIVQEAFAFVFWCIRGVAFLFVLGGMIIAPAIIGILNHHYGMDLFNELNPYEDLGSAFSGIISFMCGIIVALVWGWMIPLIMDHSVMIESFFRIVLELPTRWEIFPWSWALLALGEFIMAQMLAMAFDN